MINVLFIAMEFAPVNTTGNFRSLKFVKYFNSFGINPFVITLDVESAQKIFKSAKVDKSLLDDLPSGTEIYRIPCEDPDKYYSGKFRTFLTIYFSIKDNIAKRWEKNLMNKIEAIIEKHNPKAIITTLPPFSAGDLAAQHSGRFKLPLVLDMRDGWTKWCISPYGSRLHYYLTYLEEKQIFKRASAITTVTNQLADVFKETHKDVDPQKFHVVTNGYDTDLNFENDEEIEIGRHDNNVEFNIGYTGAFYYSPKGRRDMFLPWWKKRFHRILQYTPVKEDWLYRSPYFFFKTVRQVLDNNPDFKLRIKFIGEKPDWLAPMADEFNLADICDFYGVLSHEESLEVQKNLDAFLCTSVKVIGGFDYVLASKTFDYVRYKKPILGFVTEGSQREFLDKSGLGFICDPDKIVEASKELGRIIRGGFSMKPNISFLNSYKRKNRAGEMASVIKSVVDESNSQAANA